MEQSFIGAIFLFAGNFAMMGFALCQGQLISIAQNDTLFQLLGTTFGGDEQNTFALPDLRGRVAMGQGPALSTRVIGQSGGSENVTLTTNNMPSHTHLVNVNSASATLQTPTTQSFLGAVVTNGSAESLYASTATGVTLNPATIGLNGGSQPVNIMQPSLALNYVISLFGVYPSQN